MSFTSNTVATSTAATWQQTLNSKIVPSNIHCWLTKPKIISTTMQACCENLTLSLLSQQQAQVLPDEAEILELNSDEQALVRMIYLCGNSVPWSFGRVIVPQPTYKKYQQAFDNLGTKPIGVALLHYNPKVRRSKFEYTELNSGHTLFQLAIQSHSFETQPINLWARRSLFFYNNLPLLINEVYLPNIPKYPNHMDTT